MSPTKQEQAEFDYYEDGCGSCFELDGCIANATAAMVADQHRIKARQKSRKFPLRIGQSRFIRCDVELAKDEVTTRPLVFTRNLDWFGDSYCPVSIDGYVIRDQTEDVLACALHDAYLGTTYTSAADMGWDWDDEKFRWEVAQRALESMVDLLGEKELWLIFEESFEGILSKRLENWMYGRQPIHNPGS